ncbi:hypothetical protein HAX54_052556, partial [Datura stramonium]|nr:hypothetical protein [Datura stramonium]
AKGSTANGLAHKNREPTRKKKKKDKQKREQTSLEASPHLPPLPLRHPRWDELAKQQSQEKPPSKSS